MPYQINPTFTDGNVLLASQLQILADNADFLWNLVSGVNIPFTGDSLTASGTSRTYTFRRQGRYLHYHFEMTTGTSDELDVRLDGFNEAGDATNRTAPYTWSGYIDLQATTSNPAVGDDYEVFVEFDFASAGTFLINYLIESESTTL